MKTAVISALVTAGVVVLILRFVPPVRNFALGGSVSAGT